MEKKHLVGLAAVAAVGVMVYMMRKNATATLGGAVTPDGDSTFAMPWVPPTIVHTDGPNFAPIPQPVVTKPAAPVSSAVSVKASTSSGWGGVQNTPGAAAAPAPKPTAPPPPPASGSVSTFVGVQGPGTAAPRPAPAPSARAGKVAEGWARINAQKPVVAAPAPWATGWGNNPDNFA